ncbi:hypothetical protein [Cupriavidus sp. IDO]|uniref:hypothetical protein n=1 Tax=Cupriavidus sp. IDO TaxID=1539142 RepID=UPI000578FAD3|nr:hypothetical protein [Cupriavidus sp. IDO]KWR83376.1 hypothetical protein RM96_28350 [Cupriavidus sp. IDO]
MSKLVCAGLAALVLFTACTDAGRSVDCAGGISMGGSGAVEVLGEMAGAAFPMNGGQFSLYLLR